MLLKAAKACKLLTGTVCAKGWRRIGTAVSVILLGCALWWALHSQPEAPHITPFGGGADTAGWGCGPAALLTVAAAADAGTASRMRAQFERDGLGVQAVTTFHDLAGWAKTARLDPIGLRVDTRDLSRLPLPAIVHVRPDHFLTLVDVNDSRVVVTDRSPKTQQISRREFDRRFSGHVLCFKRFLGRSGEPASGDG